MLLSELIVKIFVYAFSGVLALYALGGFIKGGRKMGVRLFFLIISLVLSVVLSMLLTDVFKPYVERLVQTINLAELQELINASPSLIEYVYALITALIGPILFLILFLVISLLMKIPGIFVNRMVNEMVSKNGEKPKNTWLNRGVGVLIGLICGVVATSALFTPFLGYMTLADQVYSEVTEKELVVENETVNLVFNNVHDSQKSRLIALETKLTSPLFNLTCKVRTNSGASSIMKEVEMFSSLAVDVINFINESNQNEGENQNFSIDFEAIDNIVDSACASPNLKAILAEILSTASSKWTNNQPFLTLNLKEFLHQQFQDDLDGALDVLLKDFTVSTASTIQTDIKNLTATLKTAVGLTDTLSDLTSGSIENISSLDTTIIEEALEIVNESQKLKEILAVLMAKAGEDWLKGDVFLGFSPNSIEGVPQDFNNALKVIYNEFAQTEEKTVCEDIRGYVEAINIISQMFEKISALNFEDYNSIDINQIDDLVDLIGENVTVKKVMSVVLNDAGSAWGDTPSRPFAEINIKENLPENYQNVFDKNFDQFKTANENNVVQVLQTFSDTMKAYKYILNLASSSTSGSDTLENDMENFVISVTPNNVDILKDTINADVLEDVGVQSSDAPIVETLFDSALDSISGMEDDKKAEESVALNKLFVYSQQLQTEGSTTISNQEMIDTIVESEALSKSVVDYAESGSTQTLTVSEADKQEILNSLTKYENGSEKDKQTAESLKALFGIS